MLSISYIFTEIFHLLAILQMSNKLENRIPRTTTINLFVFYRLGQACCTTTVEYQLKMFFQFSDLACSDHRLYFNSSEMPLLISIWFDCFYSIEEFQEIFITYCTALQFNQKLESELYGFLCSYHWSRDF